MVWATLGELGKPYSMSGGSVMGPKTTKNGLFSRFFYSVVSGKFCDDWKGSDSFLLSWPFNLGHIGWAWEASQAIWGPSNGSKATKNGFFSDFSILSSLVSSAMPEYDAIFCWLSWPNGFGHIRWVREALGAIWGSSNGTKNDQKWTFLQFYLFCSLW